VIRPEAKVVNAPPEIAAGVILETGEPMSNKDELPPSEFLGCAYSFSGRIMANASLCQFFAKAGNPKIELGKSRR
jgi:hypothetical protein